LGTTISVSGSGNVDITVFGRGTVIAGNGNDSIDITGKGKIIVGSGHDTLTLGSGGVIIEHGSAGHDTINLGTGNYTIYEQGHATVTGAFGSATISGGTLEITQTGGQGQDHGHGHGHAFGDSSVTEGTLSGKTTLLGSTAHVEFVGGAGSAYMKGGAGNYTFIGGSGHDTMIGGTGHNLFEFLSTEKGGQHLIKNFVAGQDQLVVEGHSLAYLQQHHDISTHGGNTYISIDGGKTTIELHGVTSLNASDFTSHK
jgi:Ca2+-binding RTX toxin-like protein